MGTRGRAFRKKGGRPVRRAIGLLLAPLCAVVILSLLVTPQSKIQHQDSSAFGKALQQAVYRLEGGSKMLLAGTATPVLAAAAQQCTFDGRYTCETYDPVMTTCDPGTGCIDHTAEPQGHTCSNEWYTCQIATCDTYDPQMATCDPNSAECCYPHTAEPEGMNHTCDGHTCDRAFTCDYTVDPRWPTCNAAYVDCTVPTRDAFVMTCNPMQEECRLENPDHCTSDMYPTCDPSQPTCDPVICETVDPNSPHCGTPVRQTTWGGVKAIFR